MTSAAVVTTASRVNKFWMKYEKLSWLWNQSNTIIAHYLTTGWKKLKSKCFFWLCWGLTTRQPLWVILCRLPEKGRKETEEIEEEMKERDREERGTGMKVKKKKK